MGRQQTHANAGAEKVDSVAQQSDKSNLAHMPSVRSKHVKEVAEGACFQGLWSGRVLLGPQHCFGGLNGMGSGLHKKGRGGRVDLQAAQQSAEQQMRSDGMVWLLTWGWHWVWGGECFNTTHPHFDPLSRVDQRCVSIKQHT
jgi:hypothetical protein